MILAFPHAGTDIPTSIFDQLNANGKILADTDWHIDKLYDGVIDNATTVRALFHRYVIDANRDPAGESLYPGQNTTGLVPLSDFDGVAIWLQNPNAEDITKRLAQFHAPYHAALCTEIERVKTLHGYAILFDCHSIRSQIPFLFDGRLPDLNIGTNGGRTCDPAIELAALAVARKAQGYSYMLNGRFKGGWTTRQYGQPSENVHAIQLELSQSTYLSSEAPPFSYDKNKAARLCPHLKTMLQNIIAAMTGHDK